MKRLIALTMTLGIICGCTACGEKQESNSGNSATLAETQKLMLNAADIRMGDKFKSIKCLSKDASGENILTFGELKNGGFAGFVSGNDFNDYADFTFTPRENETVHSAALLPYGKKAVLTIFEGSTFIHIYDKDNNFEKTIDCGEVIDSESPYISRIYGNRDAGFIINVVNSQILAVSSEGRFLGEIKTNSMSIGGVVQDSENKINILLDDMKNIYSASADSAQLSAITEQTYKSTGSSAYAVGAGAGKYRYIGVFHDGIYGFTDTEIVMLADFLELSFENYQVRDIFMLSENEIVINVSEAEGDKLYLLTEAVAALPLSRP